MNFKDFIISSSNAMHKKLCRSLTTLLIITITLVYEYYQSEHFEYLSESIYMYTHDAIQSSHVFTADCLWKKERKEYCRQSNKKNNSMHWNAYTRGQVRNLIDKSRGENSTTS